MINKIIGTVGTRVYVGIVLLIILGLHSKNLGAEILGHLAIFRFALTINHLFASIFSAPIVFVGNKIAISRLILPALIWIIVSALLLTILQTMFHLVAEKHFYHLLFLSLLYSTQSLFEQVLLCKQQIKLFNFSSVLYHSVLLGTCIFLIFNLGWITEDVFFYSMYASLVASNVFLIITTIPYFKISQFGLSTKIAGILFKYGFWVQITNFIQTLNYRVCLIMLDLYWGKKVVGYFSAGLQLAEAIWIIAKSLATVQYAKIAASKAREYAVELTLLLSKASFFISFLASVVLLLIPEKTLGFYLGKDFTNVKEIMLYLMPGILFFSISLIYCHYFSGIGKYFFNSIGSIISLIIIVSGGLLFIPQHGANAAAIINSVGLFGMLLFNIIILNRVEKISFRKLLPLRNDLKKSFTIIKDYLKLN